VTGRYTPPSVDPTAFVVGWCATEDEMDDAYRGTFLSLTDQLGDRQTSPVQWAHLSGDLATSALDEMQANPANTLKMFDHYRRLRASLREYGGYLVIAYAKGRVERASDRGLREHFGRNGTPKRAFTVEAECRAIAAAVQDQRGSKRRPYHAYLCGACGLWHVGRKPPQGKRA
jgi:hypothetical protein